MKLVTLTILALTLGISAFSQNEPSKNLPPIKTLPKEGEIKHIYELPEKTDYKIYNTTGELIHEGNAQFIDYTEYKADTYFIVFHNKTEKFTKK